MLETSKFSFKEAPIEKMKLSDIPHFIGTEIEKRKTAKKKGDMD